MHGVTMKNIQTCYFKSAFIQNHFIYRDTALASRLTLKFVNSDNVKAFLIHINLLQSWCPDIQC